MKSRKLFFPILAFAALLAPMAHAQFGSGIVYDPTQFGASGDTLYFEAVKNQLAGRGGKPADGTHDLTHDHDHDHDHAHVDATEA